ncbi:hypothetical protein D3C87_1448930 [compost metagenome]
MIKRPARKADLRRQFVHRSRRIPLFGKGLSRSRDQLDAVFLHRLDTSFGHLTLKFIYATYMNLTNGAYFGYFIYVTYMKCGGMGSA